MLGRPAPENLSFRGFFMLSFHGILSDRSLNCRPQCSFIFTTGMIIASGDPDYGLSRYRRIVPQCFNRVMPLRSDFMSRSFVVFTFSFWACIFLSNKRWPSRDIIIYIRKEEGWWSAPPGDTRCSMFFRGSLLTPRAGKNWHSSYVRAVWLILGSNWMLWREV